MIVQQTDFQHLNPTAIIYSDHPLIAAHVEKTIDDSKDPVDFTLVS